MFETMGKDAAEQHEDVLTTFVRFYEREAATLTRRVAALVSDRDVADDLVSAATMRMLRLIQRGKVAPGEESVAKLFTTILHGKRVDHERGKAAERRLRDELTQQALTEATPRSGERLTDLLAPLNLAQTDLDLLRLRFELAWDYERVADALGINSAAARKRISRLLVRLGQQLGRDVIRVYRQREKSAVMVTNANLSTLSVLIQSGSTAATGWSNIPSCSCGLNSCWKSPSWNAFRSLLT